jgi:predicted lipoprotein with Yx(FWY)xxD motif
MQRPTNHWQLIGRLAGAGLLTATAAIHLDLYLTGYRSVPTIGGLFLLQVIAGFVLAALTVVTTGWLVPAAGAAFAVTTLGGYLVSVRANLFGFTEVRTTAGTVAGVIEVATFAALAVVAIGSQAPLRVGVGLRDRAPSDRRRSGVRLWGAVAGLSLVAVVLFGSAVASASTPRSVSAGGGSELEARQFGGHAVLTDARGFTLYAFAPDTPTTSHCSGDCVAYWPPAIGSPTAGPGVNGQLGTIRRSDGSAQATFDGHPLYTYAGDSAPGQANGNGLRLNGGLWRELAPSDVTG